MNKEDTGLIRQTHTSSSGQGLGLVIQKCTYRKTHKSSSRTITSAMKPLSKLFLIFGLGLSLNMETPSPKTWKKVGNDVALN